MNDCKNYTCPICGCDIREKGIYETTFVNYKFDETKNKFIAVDIEPRDYDYIRCAECHDDLDYNFEENLNIDRSVKHKKEYIRYGNIYREVMK